MIIFVLASKRCLIFIIGIAIGDFEVDIQHYFAIHYALLLGLIHRDLIMIFGFLHPLVCIGGINACVIFCFLIVTVTLVYC